MMPEIKKGIGLMSGTSLDGLDIAFCEFSNANDVYHYQILQAETINYSRDWKDKLTFDAEISAYDLKKLDLEFGNWIGIQANRFIETHQLKPAFIASHGHTWFHEPENRINVQIGDGYEIYRHTRIPVVNDFRSLDIRMGGQGAPLVPIGDELLFAEFDCCVNLGGIANVSGVVNGKRLSYDVAPFNLVLNYLSEKLGLSFDKNGELARTGKLTPSFKSDLEKLTYFSSAPPKSLGIEWIREEIFPLVEKYSQHEPADLMNTYVAFCTEQLIKSFYTFDKQKSVLITGGGAYHQYFVDNLIQKAGDSIKIVKPSAEVIDFKEAMIFAFLGLLRLENKVNCLKEVTGARSAVSGGVIFDQLIR